MDKDFPEKDVPLVGLQSTASGLEFQRAIHCATRAHLRIIWLKIRMKKKQKKIIIMQIVAFHQRYIWCFQVDNNNW